MVLGEPGAMVERLRLEWPLHSSNFGKAAFRPRRQCGQQTTLGLREGWETSRRQACSGVVSTSEARGMRWVGTDEDSGAAKYLETRQGLDEALDAVLLGNQQASVLVYGSLLQACTRRKDLAKARHLHAHIAKSGLECHGYLGDWIVNMLVKCRGLADAIQVFNRLSTPSALSWTALISGYSKGGQGQEALRTYRLMQEQGVEPNKHTFVGVLKACAILADLDEGKRIHAEVVKYNCETDLFVGTSLVDMYARCGKMEDAWQVFDTLSHRDVGLWNSMIAGCAQEDLGDKSLQLYEQMKEEGVSPDERTFVGILKACSSIAAEETEVAIDCRVVKLGSLHRGKSIHAEILRRGIDLNLFVANTLMHMYASCGSVCDARNVFDSSLRRNVVSWNAMIAGYVRQEQGDQALKLYAEMRVAGMEPNDRTFASVLKACGSIAALDEGLLVDERLVKVEALQQGRVIHADIVRTGYQSDVFVGNTLVHMYAHCGSLVDARHVFDMLSRRDVVTWNAMIAGYALQDQGEDALQLFTRMQETRVRPNDRTFVSVLKACGSMAAMEKATWSDGQSFKEASLEKAKVLHAQVIRSGYDSDVYVGNSLVHMYASCGSVLDARLVFDRLSRRDRVSWNAMILGYAEQEEAENALQLYSDMQEDGVAPDETTFLCLLKACSKLGALSMCKKVCNNIVGAGFEWSVTVASAMVHAYGRCGSMVEARKIFDSYPHHNVFTCTALIAGYARRGNYELSLQAFQEMQRMGMRPNSVTFVPILSACSHTGMVDQGMVYFESMSRDYGLIPTTEHYVSIVDLLGRAGLFEEAEGLISTMPTQPGLAVWLSLLGGCRKYGNVECGRRAFKHAVGVEPKHCAAYTLMQNIYVHAQMWHEAEEIEAMRVRAGAWKKPGRSWIEHQGKVYTFLVGLDNQPHAEPVYAKLAEINNELDVRIAV